MKVYNDIDLIYGSVCSGIEAASVAWEPLGWKPAWFSEIEKFPSRVLKHHYPNVPNLGDMLKIHEKEEYKSSAIDLLVGGTPCQSFSLAGLRKGLTDDRGNLAFGFCRILIEKQPLWFVWENVPGVFTSFSDEALQTENADTISQSSDFATLLTAFSECGYSCAWAVLDSLHFGVPQRRRRIFVVGYRGNDWRPPYTVLFEPEGVRRHIEKGKKKGKDFTGTLDARTTGGGFPGSDGAANGHVIPVPCFWDGSQTSQTLDAVLAKGQMMPEKNRFPAILCFTANDHANDLQEDAAPTLRSGGHDKSHSNGGIAPAIVYSIRPQNSGKSYVGYEADYTQAITTVPGSSGTQGGEFVMQQLRVRKLTPLECERLQGFPDNYTNIPGASDSARYKSIGNSMTTNVMNWIGSRINRFQNG